ncbi:MAG: hypothetical protein WKF79_01590 [Nocardioides sp.]
MAKRVAGVSPHPLVAIDVVDEEQILINGIALPAGESGDPHQRAVHAVATEVARPLGRPVRARATDPDGTTWLVIHPDGSVSDIEANVAPNGSAATIGSARAAEPGEVANDLGREGFAPAKSSGGIPEELTAPGWLAARDVSREALAAASKPRPSGRSARTPVLLALAATVLMAVGGAVLLTGEDEPGPTTGANAEAGAVVDDVDDVVEDVRPPAAAPALAQTVLRRSAPLELLQLQSVSATGAVGAATLQLELSRPGVLQLVLRRPGGGPAVTQQVRVASAGIHGVTLRNLAAATWTWMVRAPGESPLAGTVGVTAPAPPVAVPDETYEPPTPDDPPYVPPVDSDDVPADPAPPDGGGGDGGTPDGRGGSGNDGGGSGGGGPVDPDAPDGPNGPVG